MESSNESSDMTHTKAQENLLGQALPNSSSNGNPITFEHPLLNPLIVDLIVDYLHPNFDHLKTLRLVSKVWTQATLKHWRKSGAVLALVPEPANLSESKCKKGITVSKFLKEFQDPVSPFQLSHRPFLKYKLKDFSLDYEACSDPGDSSNLFWNEIGPLMESVHFYKCKFIWPVKTQYSNASSSLSRFLVELIPNLKDVALTNSVTTYTENDPGEDHEDDNLEKLEVVQRSHPNLRTLTVYGDSGTDMSLDGLFMAAPGLEVITGVDLETFSSLKQTLLYRIYEIKFFKVSIPPALSRLKHVDLINSGVLEDADYYWNTPPNRIPPPPLETLILHLEPDTQETVVMTNLDRLLKSFSRTLKTFKAFRAPVGPPYLKFISDFWMTSLEELHLMGTIAPNFSFLRGTPNLKKLVIDLGCFEKKELTRDLVKANFREYEDWMYRKYEENMVTQVPSHLDNRIFCSELEYLEIDYEFPGEDLRMLGKWMPNLKTLKTILNGETVPVVCDVWGDLTELVCLHGSKVGNSCFIRGDEENAGHSVDTFYSKTISCLKDLERFQLDAYCDECYLTDDVVFKGFLKMSGLKSVEICANFQMSGKAENALRKGIPFCKVVRSKCFGSSGNVFVDRCDRCKFRREAEIFRRRDNEDEDSSGSGESEDEDRHQFVELDEDELSGSGESNISLEIW